MILLTVISSSHVFIYVQILEHKCHSVSFRKPYCICAADDVPFVPFANLLSPCNKSMSVLEPYQDTYAV